MAGRRVFRACRNAPLSWRLGGAGPGGSGTWTSCLPEGSTSMTADHDCSPLRACSAWPLKRSRSREARLEDSANPPSAEMEAACSRSRAMETARTRSRNLSSKAARCCRQNTAVMIMEKIMTGRTAAATSQTTCARIFIRDTE